MKKQAQQFYLVITAEVSLGYGNPFSDEGIDQAIAIELGSWSGFVLEAYIRPNDARKLLGDDVSIPISRAVGDKMESAMLINSGRDTIVVCGEEGYHATFSLQACGLDFLNALRGLLN